MKSVGVPLLLLLAAAAGAGVWLATGLVREEERPSPVERPSPSAVDADLQEAANRLKAADTKVGPHREIEIQAARRRLVEAEAQAPDDPRVAFWRGMTGVLARDEAEARAAEARLRALRGVSPRDPSLRFLGALILLTFDREKPEAAIRLLRSIQAEAPGFMPEPVDRALYRALLETAAVRSDARESEKVVRLVQEAVERAKDDPVRSVESRRMLAYAYARAHRYLEAQEEWEWLVRRSNGQAADFVAGLANSFSAQNQWEQAITEFTRAIELQKRGKAMRLDDPALDEILLRRGNCYRMLGQTDLARADLEAHLAAHPDDHRAMYWLAQLALDPLDEPDRAMALLEKARALAPYCENYLRLLLQVVELRKPDPARAAALRRELELGEAARQKERERLAKESREGRFICE